MYAKIDFAERFFVKLLGVISGFCSAFHLLLFSFFEDDAFGRMCSIISSQTPKKTAEIKTEKMERPTGPYFDMSLKGESRLK